MHAHIDMAEKEFTVFGLSGSYYSERLDRDEPLSAFDCLEQVRMPRTCMHTHAHSHGCTAPGPVPLAPELGTEIHRRGFFPVWPCHGLVTLL